MTSVTDLKNATALSQNPHIAPSQEMGKNDFLRLLMTQLSNQDPTSPQDPTQFVTQLSQFSQVESLTNLSSKMDELVKINSATNAAGSVSLLGKEIRVDSNKIVGPATVFYNQEKDSVRSKIEILDTSGKVVKMVDNLPNTKGVHEVEIKDLAEGSYTFRVVAYDDAGKDVKSQLSVLERITGVNFTESSPVLLTASGQKLTAGQVAEIREPKVQAGS